MERLVLPATWTVLVYTVPSDPSRLRMTVWRELKKAGTIYLRDGVCVLPTRAKTAGAFRAIAELVAELGGQATLLEDSRIEPRRARIIAEQASAERAAEYAEVERDAEGFLAHIERERTHRHFTLPELKKYEADLGKLKRWMSQIRDRDHFGAPGGAEVDSLLQRGESALAAFIEDAYHQTEDMGT